MTLQILYTADNQPLILTKFKVCLNFLSRFIYYLALHYMLKGHLFEENKIVEIA